MTGDRIRDRRDPALARRERLHRLHLQERHGHGRDWIEPAAEAAGQRT
jgi:hypothetical protein